MSTQPSFWQAHEPGPRRFSRRAGTVIAVLTSLLTGLGVVAFAAQDDRPLEGLGWLLISLLVSISLIWRMRAPVALCLASSVLTVLLPLDAFAALLTWSWVITLRRGPWPWVCGVIAAAATAATLTRDHLRPPEHSLLATHDAETGEIITSSPSGYVTIGILLLLVFGGWGVLRRLRRAAREARAAESAKEREAARLRAELSRQDERNLIAREMHDTVAHHLSLVALQASALEVASEDPDAARTIRSSAQHALDEMRGLITSLRTGEGPTGMPGGDVPSMADLAGLIDRARGAGASLSSSIYLENASQAPLTLTRAVYRILQESLTNALKHAPGEHVSIAITGAPGTGVDLMVRNRASADDVHAAGGGAGIIGMTERAQAAGGELSVTTGDGEHVVRARLPWPEQDVTDPQYAPPRDPGGPR